jgi:hypothetical protein
VMYRHSLSSRLRCQGSHTAPACSEMPPIEATSPGAGWASTGGFEYEGLNDEVLISACVHESFQQIEACLPVKYEPEPDPTPFPPGPTGHPELPLADRPGKASCENRFWGLGLNC